MTAFKDTYGDSLRVSPGANDTVRVEVDYARNENAIPMFVRLTREVAIDVAQALIEAATPATPANLFGEDPEDEREGWNLDALTAAAEYRRDAEFTYPGSEDGVLRRRVVSVEELTETKAGRTLVIGHDKTAADVRAFRVDRIVGHVLVR